MTRLAAACLFLFLVLGVASTGCDTVEPPAECPDEARTDCPDPPEPAVIDGVDLTALFAAPTLAEIDSVQARLGRTGGTDAPRAERLVTTQLATDSDGTRYLLLSLQTGTGQTAALGLARVPANDLGAGAPLPVVVLLPDGDGSVREGSVLDGGSFLTGPLPALNGLDDRTVQIALAARGAALTARTTSPPLPGAALVTRRPDLPAAPYRADVLDVLALTDRLEGVPRADAARVALVGVGRGGAVALLAAERRPGRFRAVGALGAPTTLFDLTFRTSARDVLLGRPVPRLPAAEALLAPVRALRTGTISLAEARLRLLELSATPFAGRLPATVAFHADPDDIVPFAQFERFRETGSGTLDAPRRFEVVPQGVHETLLAQNAVAGILSLFFSERFQP